MNLKKLLALALGLCLVLSLAACGAPGAAENSSESPTNSGSPSPSPSDSPSESPAEPLPAYVNEHAQALAGVDGDAVMFTVDGMDVTAEYYFYWLAYYCYMMDLQYQMAYGVPLDFEQAALDGISYADHLKEDARKMATVYLILEKEAPAKGAGVTPEQQAELDAQDAAIIEEQGQEDFDRILHQQGLSLQLYQRLNRMSGPLLQNMLATFPAPTQADLDQCIEENDLLRAKHILIRTVVQQEDGSVAYARGGSPTNEDGSPYAGTAEEFNAAALEKANGILEQLNAADDPLALFDQLMQEYSEDPGLETNPDGYDFTAGQMVSNFEQGTRDLEYGKYSAQPVQTDDGYHIILRLRPEVTEEDYRQTKMALLMEEWAALDFTPAPAYEALDVKDFYTKYTARMESFMEQETESPAPTESPSESPSASPTPGEPSSEAPSASPSATPQA